MKETIEELNRIVEQFSERLMRLPDDEFNAKPSPRKWSKKEVIGHLIDSAHNNFRRFVVGQYDEAVPVIVYDQDFWVKANAYQKMDRQEIVMLWKLMNRRICTVLTEMPSSAHGRQLNTGKESVQLHSLEWLAADYVKHLKHHLNQVFSQSFDIVYP